MLKDVSTRAEQTCAVFDNLLAQIPALLCEFSPVAVDMKLEYKILGGSTMVGLPAIVMRHLIAVRMISPLG